MSDALSNEVTTLLSGGSLNYTRPVKFSETNRYGGDAELPEDEDDVYTVKEFKNCVKVGAFVDDDGVGHPVKGGKADPKVFIKPSTIDKIPQEATHVVWYNK
jgi:hypothetical protein